MLASLGVRLVGLDGFEYFEREGLVGVDDHLVIEGQARRREEVNNWATQC